LPSQSRVDAAEDRIELVDPDPSWPGQYAAEASALIQVLPRAAGVCLEHFGSTAIPDIRAKPIIDILVIHPYPGLWRDLIGPIASLGYVFWPENPRKDRMFFVKGMPPFGPRRTHHVHVRVPSDAKTELLFRDALRGDRMLARRYAELKDALAVRYRHDRDACTEAKTDFIAEVLRRTDER
jgi:GrpB-like predicted nucleotidyltransferase (UPF0157 family)